MSEPELHSTLSDGQGWGVMKFLKFVVILELYLELSYFVSQIFIMVTVTEVTKVPKFLSSK